MAMQNVAADVVWTPLYALLRIPPSKYSSKYFSISEHSSVRAPTRMPIHLNYSCIKFPDSSTFPCTLPVVWIFILGALHCVFTDCRFYAESLSLNLQRLQPLQRAATAKSSHCGWTAQSFFIFTLILSDFFHHFYNPSDDHVPMPPC